MTPDHQRQNMVDLNRHQADYYDSICQVQSYSKNSAANPATRFWAHLRNRQYSLNEQCGLIQTQWQIQKQWLTRIPLQNVLEVGPFTGNPITFRLADLSKTFTVVELSGQAIETLRQKLLKKNPANTVRLIHGDFLNVELPGSFDLIVLHGVLHHFQHLPVALDRLSALCRPDAHVLLTEPLAVQPAFRAIRALYRPLQKDRAWEWPFGPLQIAQLQQHFQIVEGFGWGRRSTLLSPLCSLPGLQPLLFPFYRRLVNAELQTPTTHPRFFHHSYMSLLCRPRSHA